MYRIRMSCDNRRGVLRMDKMLEAASDFRPVFRWAQRELGKMNRDNYTASGLPVGGWSPLKPAYSAWKARNFPGAPIMVQTGRLFRAVGQMNGAGTKIGRNRAEFNVGVDYASFHQYGTTRMEKRRVVLDTPLFAREVAREAKDHITDAANGVIRRP